VAGQVQEEILQIGGTHLHAGERHAEAQQPRQQGRHVGAAQLHLIASRAQGVTKPDQGRMSRKAHQHAVKMLGQQGDRGIQAEQMAVIDDGNLIAQLLGLVQLDDVKEVGLFLTGIFPLLFVPAAAGVMELWAEMGSMLLPIVIAIIPVTVLVLVTSGHTTQALTRRKQSKKEAAANDTAAE
jgi:holin-like protein